MIRLPAPPSILITSRAVRLCTSPRIRVGNSSLESVNREGRFYDINVWAHNISSNDVKPSWKPIVSSPQSTLLAARFVQPYWHQLRLKPTFHVGERFGGAGNHVLMDRYRWSLVLLRGYNYTRRRRKRSGADQSRSPSYRTINFRVWPTLQRC
ncbi:hypothetical protein M404DRAFT_992490 [Pisolithus tinctorius Marx 270]|uniref:Uncharacterized protein n=1 Tax=Pisolithus tinctorius Marx 270 TaxID=870435 RepID=A0A0C3KXG7_PISTI|nr:hypothetical protein M404DRAFT_992490 [Pisolithus tinctorius Marx 270]